MTSEKILSPGEGPKQITKVIDRIGVAPDGKSGRIKFVDSGEIFTVDLTLPYLDEKHTSDDDFILSKPGDLVEVTVEMRFGKHTAYSFNNLSLSGVRGSAD